jgi:hypothetical protein
MWNRFNLREGDFSGYDEFLLVPVLIDVWIIVHNKGCKMYQR